MELRFIKMQGIGNDFVMFDCLAGEPEPVPDWSDLAVKLCDRKFGIGADGILILKPSEKYDVTFRICNSDGSMAQMCGNGMRCAAKYLFENGLVKERRIRVDTKAGLVVPEVLPEKDGTVNRVRVDMGEPVLECRKIPYDSDAEKAVEVPIEVEDTTFLMTAVSMGNPHAVIFVDDINEVDAVKFGRSIEHHPAFPEKTNVEFVHVAGPDQLRMRVWERGVGITLACGTGACAVMVAAVLTGRVSERARIELDGGCLEMEWDRSDNRVFKTGPAKKVFEGVVQV